MIRIQMIRQSDLGAAAAACVILALVTLSPLPFGGVLPRERVLIDVGAFVALALVVAGRHELGDLRPAARPALALAAVGAWGILQSLPWPRFLVGLVAPPMVGVWTTAPTPEALVGWGIPLSLAPEVSRATGLHWLALAGALAAAGVVGRYRQLTRLVGLGLAAVTVLEIVYGLGKWFEQSSTIWGVEVGGELRLRGTFVNPDHFATFLLIPLAVSFAWAWWSLRRAMQTSSLERRLLYLTIPWLVFLLVFVALAFTGSRGGLVGALMVLVVQTVLLAVHYRRWQAALVGAGAVLMGFAGVFFFGFQSGLGRWLGTSAYELTWNLRIELYQATLELWRRFPLTGTGLGTFRQAFPRVQPANLDLTWIHAHSDVLEILVTAGPLALLVLAVAFFGLFATLRDGFTFGRRSEDRAVSLAAAGAVAGVAAHSFVDFGLTLPANALILAVLVGLACGSPRHRPADLSAAPTGGS